MIFVIVIEAPTADSLKRLKRRALPPGAKAAD